MKPARVLVADPPWSFSDKLPGKSRGAAKNYEVLSIESVRSFPLPDLAPDAVLFLWRVSAMQEEALSVVRAWGFKPHSELVWDKVTKNGKPHFGMGRIVRGSHETCLIAVRGKARPLVRNIRSRFEATVGRHSEKPAAFYRIVERLFEGPFVELFARRRRKGWRCYGDQLPRRRSRK